MCLVRIFVFELIRGRLNGATTQKIRTHHEILTRENEKLARQLHQRDEQQQRGQSSSKRIYVVEEEPPIQEVKYIPHSFSFSFFL
jgi:hypothetical protein